MTEEIRVGPRENAFASNEERINYALKLRSELIRTKPITDRQITRLDKWLIAQPNLPIAAVVQIWTRMMWVSAAEYSQEQDPLVKHFNLLSLRDHLHDFLALPDWMQEDMGPYWLDWLELLQTEERKLERANAH
jgi:hypothetical protein